MFLLVAVAYKTQSIFSPTHMQLWSTISGDSLKQRGKMRLTLLSLALATLLVASSAYVPAGRPYRKAGIAQFPAHTAQFQAERPHYGEQDIAQ
jgi:hypothetical protein